MTHPHPRFGLGVNNCHSVSHILSAVEAAEQLGAETAFVSEDINCRDAFELAALGATHTQRIRLATGVVNPYTRNPSSLAMAIATLDEISGGRAILGLGTSSVALIEGQMGLARQQPLRTMQEVTEIVRALLTGETVTYHGTVFTYVDAHLEARPVQSHLPIYIAAMGPRMLRLVGELADGVLLNVGASVDYVRWAISQIHAGAAAAGRQPSEITVAAWLTVYVTDDRTAGIERARQLLARMLSVPGQGEVLLQHAGFDTSILPQIRAHFQAYPHRGNLAEAAQYVPADVAEQLTLIGTPAQVHQRLNAYRAAGVELPVMGIATLRALF